MDSIDLTKDEKLYLNKFKASSKKDFCNFILSLETNEKKEALSNFTFLFYCLGKVKFVQFEYHFSEGGVKTGPAPLT